MDKSETGSEHEKEARHAQAAQHDAKHADMHETGTHHDEAGHGHTEQMMADAMSSTGRVGSGMMDGAAHLATDLVHGVGTVGGEVVNVVRDTANFAIVGVGSIGETAVHTVAMLLSDLVGGLRDIGSAAMRGSRADQAEGESRARGTDRQHEETLH